MTGLRARTCACAIYHRRLAVLRSTDTIEDRRPADQHPSVSGNRLAKCLALRDTTVGADASAFPANPDTGDNGDLLLEPAHLERFAGISDLAEFTRLSGGRLGVDNSIGVPRTFGCIRIRKATLERSEALPCPLPAARGGFCVFSDVPKSGDSELRLPVLGCEPCTGPICSLHSISKCSLSIRSEERGP